MSGTVGLRPESIFNRFSFDMDENNRVLDTP